ncbi:MAG: chemotaxis protein CheB [Deltaproteobacteria bacterium]|nr:chemotaxis protein CheB [Deltaproteobacteria bacterium]
MSESAKASKPGKASRTAQEAKPSLPAPVVEWQEESSIAPDGLFPIIGIGASAGGLEAIEAFLRNVPEKSGMAFVIVQHLDPTHKGIMVELLQRATSMRVVQVRDRMAIESDTVYVIPPNKDMCILRRALHLLPPIAQRGLRLPIDFFFRSLADDLQDRSIGVILSGMGSDGTLGLRTIKEKAGVVFVQSPESAKFDGMPRSAISAGLADVIAKPDDLPAKIMAYIRHAPLITPADVVMEEKAQSALDKIFILLRAHTSHDFSLYKKSTVYRRIERRMSLHQIDKIAFYVRYLQENPREIELLFRELLIGVTSFFRDPATWEEIRDKVFPALFALYPAGRQLRAWDVGCSTGEEAYSLAIIFKEALAAVKPQANFSLQIFATDLDKEAIDKARMGIYPPNITADVSAKRLQRFFIQDERGFRVGKEIREMVVLAPQNVIMDPPFTKLDILVCRNLLIYLTQELQKKLLPLFHYSLNPGGMLFLGSAETIGSAHELFDAVDVKSRIYRRLEPAVDVRPIEFPSAFVSMVPHADAENKAPAPVLNLQDTAEQILLREYAPAAVVVGPKGDILFISGRTGRYLEPPTGKVNWNILAMAREGLHYELSRGFQKAVRTQEVVELKKLKVRTNGSLDNIDVTIQPLEDQGGTKGMMMIVFREAQEPEALKHKKTRPSAKIADDSHTYPNTEIQHLKEELQNTREEMQTSQEELKSANEELQSTNEELQSTNEELTTSKEEMQSMNEELQTVNHELQSKVTDLSRANNDMKNLLDSTDIATLFLDDHLNVRRFTTGTSKIFNLLPGDAGRPITDITSELTYPEMADDARDVLRTLIFKEKFIPTSDGRWYMMRIMPYRTLDNHIDGVVITFTDVSGVRKVEMELRRSSQELENQIAQLKNELTEMQMKLKDSEKSG